MRIGKHVASVGCVATVLLTIAAPAQASGSPSIAGDPYHNACALDSYGATTTTVTDHGHLHMTDPSNGNEIGDAYFFYTPSCHGFFITTLSRGNKYYVNPTLWPSDLTSPVSGLSSLYPGNGLAWTYVLGNMTGHAACGKVAVTTPQGQAVTTVDLGCTDPV
jgi:hypothetical protein